MTDPFDEYGDKLRRALHAEADSVAPGPEGLERIRARTAGHKRRVPLLDLARRTRSALTERWWRPVVAVGAAATIAAIALSTTPIIDGPTTPAGQETQQEQNQAGGPTEQSGDNLPPQAGGKDKTRGEPGSAEHDGEGRSPGVHPLGTCLPSDDTGPTSVPMHRAPESCKPSDGSRPTDSGSDSTPPTDDETSPGTHRPHRAP